MLPGALVKGTDKRRRALMVMPGQSLGLSLLGRLFECDAAFLLDGFSLDCFHLSLQTRKFRRIVPVALHREERWPEHYGTYGRDHRIARAIGVLNADRLGSPSRHSLCFGTQL
jgi:hypothetical protein